MRSKQGTVHRYIRNWLLRVASLGLVLSLLGCATTATPAVDGPILGGIDPLPKSLSTIMWSDTPNFPQVQATHDKNKLTATLPPPTFTSTPTPMVGIFMGNITFPAGTYVLYQRGAGNTPTFQNVVSASTGISNLNATPTLSAMLSTSATPKACTIPLAVAIPQVGQIQQRIGCPRAPALSLTLVAQPFQNGWMLWRDTKQVYALGSFATNKFPTGAPYWQTADIWNDTLPASDPSLTAPSGLLQPVRGFGYVWRNNQAVRTNLGWALRTEAPIHVSWQDFDHGWLVNAVDGSVLAFVSNSDSVQTTGTYYALPVH